MKINKQFVDPGKKWKRRKRLCWGWKGILSVLKTFLCFARLIISECLRFYFLDSGTMWFNCDKSTMRCRQMDFLKSGLSDAEWILLSDKSLKLSLTDRENVYDSRVWNLARKLFSLLCIRRCVKSEFFMSGKVWSQQSNILIMREMHQKFIRRERFPKLSLIWIKDDLMDINLQSFSRLLNRLSLVFFSPSRSLQAFNSARFPPF